MKLPIGRDGCFGYLFQCSFLSGVGAWRGFRVSGARCIGDGENPGNLCESCVCMHLAKAVIRQQTVGNQVIREMLAHFSCIKTMT